MDRTSAICNVVDSIEAEMRRIGYWSEDEAPTAIEGTLFSGMGFEKWLQFEYLPRVRKACASGDVSAIPPYKIGLAALRQYDYHSFNPVAQLLSSLCAELENLLDRA